MGTYRTEFKRKPFDYVSLPPPSSSFCDVNCLHFFLLTKYLNRVGDC
jgi:hypothetical protein